MTPQETPSNREFEEAVNKCVRDFDALREARNLIAAEITRLSNGDSGPSRAEVKMYEELAESLAVEYSELMTSYANPAFDLPETRHPEFDELDSFEKRRHLEALNNALYEIMKVIDRHLAILMKKADKGKYGNGEIVQDLTRFFEEQTRSRLEK